MRMSVIKQGMAALLLLCAAAAKGQTLKITRRYHGSPVTVEAVGQPGRYTGFTVKTGSQTAAMVGFCSDSLITSPARIVKTSHGPEMLFTELQAAPGCGLTLARSRITVRLGKERYPQVFFKMTLAHFDPAAWKSVIGLQPFHFLTITMPEAVVWQQGGWLNATPLADLFPLLLDYHAGTPEISSYHYNREWSNTTPLSACPLPVIGLWNPGSGHYAAWDFQGARLRDNSERNIAVGFCNRLVLPGEALPPTDSLAEGVKNSDALLTPQQQARREADKSSASRFVSLVYPYGGLNYQDLVYPASGSYFASHARLVYSLDLKADRDPNSLLWERWWNTPALRERLPRVPLSDDLSWIGAGHMALPPEAPGGPILAGQEGNFQIPGSLLIDGWDWHNESAVAAAARTGDTARIEGLEAEAETIASHALRFTAGGQPCVYWEKPLTGRWTDAWGGDAVTTLHNANGWAAARLLLDLSRDAGQKQYLPLVDGALNWAGQMVWSRGEFADVPSSPFTIGGTSAVSFLLDYYFTFHHDAMRGTLARKAFHLAHSYVYRYLTMWTADSIRTDVRNSAFLWEPNSGRDWTGSACANEVIWGLDTLAQEAVNTADPVLMWALQGSLSRWVRLYRATYHSSLAKYDPAEMAEEYGLAPGNPYYPNGRSGYGFGGQFALLEPYGDTSVRVVAGEKAAMAFDRNRVWVRLEHYRCSGDGNFVFSLKWPRGHSEPVNVGITFPYADLSGSTITLLRHGRRTLLTAPQAERDPKALWSVEVRGIRPGDAVVVGAPALHSPLLPVSPPLTLRSSPISAPLYTPFAMMRLPKTVALDDTYSHNGYGGIWTGLRWIEGVPFLMSEKGPQGVGQIFAYRHPRSGIRDVYLLYTAAPQNDAPPLVLLDHGSPLEPLAPGPALAWRAWPIVRTARLLLAAYRIPAGRRLLGYDTSGHLALGATTLSYGPETAQLEKHIAHGMEQGAEEWRLLEASEALTGKLQTLVKGLPDSGFALLPYPPSVSPLTALLGASGFLDKSAALTPDQLVNPDQFNAEKFLFAFDLEGESYLDTVNTPHDGAAAIKDYLKNGGTLVLMTALPYPLYSAAEAGKPDTVLPLLPELGLPLYNSIETAPNETPRVERVPGETALPDLPADFPYPSGDPRLRSVDTALLPRGALYEPLYRVLGKNKSYGDAAALLTLPPGPGGRQGRILYISDVLTSSPKYGPLILEAVLRFLAKR